MRGHLEVSKRGETDKKNEKERETNRKRTSLFCDRLCVPFLFPPRTVSRHSARSCSRLRYFHLLPSVNLYRIAMASPSMTCEAFPLLTSLECSLRFICQVHCSFPRRSLPLTVSHLCREEACSNSRAVGQCCCAYAIASRDGDAVWRAALLATAQHRARRCTGRCHCARLGRCQVRAHERARGCLAKQRNEKRVGSAVEERRRVWGEPEGCCRFR